jgi:hypothetical protein
VTEGGLAAVLGSGAAVGLVVLGLRNAAAAAPPPADIESERVARAFALARVGVADMSNTWPAETLTTVQIATYSLWRGLVGSASALVQARETMLVAAGVTALLIWAAARRLGLATPTAISAALLGSITPWALAAHSVVEPANLAVPWLIAGFLLTAPGPRRRLAGVPAGIFLGIAVLTAPLAAVALLAGFAVIYAIGDAGEHWSTRARITLAASLATAGLMLLAVLAAVSGGAAPLPSAGPVDIAVAVAVIVSSVAALLVRWLRPFAAVFLVLADTAQVVPQLRTPALLLAVPIGALLLAAVAELGCGLLAARWDLERRRQQILAAGIAAAVLGAGVVAVVTVSGQSAPSGDDGPVQARRWIERNLGDDAILVVDDVVWPELVASGIPPERLLSYSGLGDGEAAPAAAVRAALSSRSDAPPVFVVGRRTSELELPVDALARSADRSSLPLARMGHGRRTEIRHVVPNVAANERAAGQEATNRRAVSTALAQNPRLVLDPAARQSLLLAEVDPRILAVLATLTARQRIGVSAFDLTTGEHNIGGDATAPLRRRARITSVDGTQITPSAPSTQLLLRWFAAQLPPYQPASTTVDPVRGITVTYLAPSPTGLLAR